MRARTWLSATALATVATIATLAGAARAQAPQTEPDFPRGRISGLVYADYYYNATGDPVHRYNATGADSLPANISASSRANGSPTVIGRDLSGVQIRRIYFQLDNDLSVKVATRFRLEADSRSLTSDGKIGVNVKAAYINVKSVYTGGNLFVGMMSTPIFENAEEIWGYRSIEKTIADFRNVASSADLGIQLKGNVDEGKRFQYNFLLGNGTGQRPETNRYKRAYGCIPLRPTDDLLIEPYADIEWGPGGDERVTYKGLIGFDTRNFVIGGEVVDRIVHAPGLPTAEPFGLSLYARTKPKNNMALFARFDRWQQDSRLANRIDSDLYIAGADWEPIKDVHFMPNVEATQYRAKGTAVAPAHHDVQARVTVYYRFSRP
jgi:hypothetical protein